MPNQSIVLFLHRDVARISPWGGPKYHFQNFSKCMTHAQVGEYPLPPGHESSGGGGGGGSGYFPKLPKWVCASQLGCDFGTLSFTAEYIDLYIATSRFHADS